MDLVLPTFEIGSELSSEFVKERMLSSSNLAVSNAYIKVGESGEYPFRESFYKECEEEPMSAGLEWQDEWEPADIVKNPFAVIVRRGREILAVGRVDNPTLGISQDIKAHFETEETTTREYNRLY